MRAIQCVSYANHLGGGALSAGSHDGDGGPWDTRLGLQTPVLCKPAVAVPEHVITQAETIDLARRLHAGHPELHMVQQMIENTGVTKRHLIRRVEDTLRHTGF